MHEVLEEHDNPYSAARKLAECTNSAVRSQALDILNRLIEQVDHGGDYYGALGLLMDMDRQGLRGQKIVDLFKQCGRDLTKMALHIRPRHVETEAPARQAVVTVEQIVRIFSQRLEAMADEPNSQELLEAWFKLESGATIRRTPATTGLLKAVLDELNVGDNHRGVNKIVFGK